MVTRVLFLVLLVLAGAGPALAAPHADTVLMNCFWRAMGEVPDSTATERSAAGRTRPGDFRELSAFFIAGVRAYQVLISSQDQPSCAFQPSCSHYSLAAVQRYGLIRGLVLSADRLLRCNGCATSYYPIDPRSGKAIDSLPPAPCNDPDGVCR